jgi:hypothetical protein
MLFLLRCIFWHLADIQLSPGDVRFWEQSGHHGLSGSCLLLTQSGHQILARPEAAARGRAAQPALGGGGMIEPRRPLCGFTGPRIYVSTRNLMTC